MPVPQRIEASALCNAQSLLSSPCFNLFRAYLFNPLPSHNEVMEKVGKSTPAWLDDHVLDDEPPTLGQLIAQVSYKRRFVSVGDVMQDVDDRDDLMPQMGHALLD